MTQVVDRPAEPVATAVPADLADDLVAMGPPAPAAEAERPPGLARPAIAVCLAMVAVAVMMGGSFDGWQPRVFAAGGGIAGVGLAVLTARTRRVWLLQALSITAIVGLSLLGALSAGVDSLGHLREVLGRAASEGRTLPTPLAFSAEWRFLVVLVAAGAAYGSGWLATDLRRPRLGLLLPLPLLVFTAIAQPPDVQTPDAIGAFALYALALAVLYRDTGPDSGLRLSRSFEIRRTARATVVVGLVVAALVGLDRADGLFPSPAYDPTRASQLPHAVPASELTDRVLFTVRSPTDGPWRTGVLTIYDGNDWRIPPIATGDLVTAGASSELDPRTAGSFTSSFTVESLDSPTLPTPTRSARLTRVSAPLDYDRGGGLLRVSPGQVPRGISYEVSSAPKPTPTDLKDAGIDPRDTADVSVPPAPPEVRRLLQAAPPSGWPRADYIRLQLLNRVTVQGTGEPASVPPSKVVEMLAGKRKPTPYELVAAEALLERWAGIPARIGYGYEGGDRQRNGTTELHPKHASTWLEVNLRGLGWFPVTGGPVRATPTLGENSTSSSSQQVIPGQDIQVNLFVPIDEVTPAPDYETIRVVVILVIAGLLLLAAAWALWPLPYKAFRRARRRAWARRTGAAARIAVAYAEFRELGIDLGDEHADETPLHYLGRVAPDLEHTELAWLVTRVLWGDIDPGPDEVNAADTLARSMRSRLARGQPGTMRMIAAVSRQSVRHPYWIDLQRGAVREAA